MTIRDLFKKEHPDLDPDMVAHNRCPGVFDYPNNPDCAGFDSSAKCDECWNREIDIPKESEKKFNFAKGPVDIEKLFTPAEPVKIPYEQKTFEVKNRDIDNLQKTIYDDVKVFTTNIKDSGARREFETGAVRDIQEGKGRCDLMPLDVASMFTNNRVLHHIYGFQFHNDILRLDMAIEDFVTYYTNWCGEGNYAKVGFPTMLLELSKHFEEGAKKYGENNWQKGIPTHCYIDSAVRHYLKYLRGDTDEPHDRAFVWNLVCCIWTCMHKPELNDYAATTEGGE